MLLPPLQSLIALETLDRLGSVNACATALHLSQSAVSHKLRNLQDILGFQVTRPSGRGVVLTSQARQYLHTVRPALDVLASAHAGVQSASGTLTISCVSGFATYWLAPRLTQFRHLFPDITLHLITRVADESTDLKIIFAPSKTAPPIAKPLMDISFFPVCSPAFADDHSLPNRPSNLTPDMMLHLNERSDWQRWLDAQSIATSAEIGGVLFDDVQPMLAAARAGQGICLGDQLTCATALRNGNLLRPFKGETTSNFGYFLVENAAPLSPSAKAFSNWLLETD